MRLTASKWPSASSTFPSVNSILKIKNNYRHYFILKLMNTRFQYQYLPVITSTSRYLWYKQTQMPEDRYGNKNVSQIFFDPPLESDPAWKKFYLPENWKGWEIWSFFFCIDWPLMFIQGYTNLVDHVQKSHPDWKNIVNLSMDRVGPIDQYFSKYLRGPKE